MGLILPVSYLQKKRVVAPAPSGPTFPDQSLATWTTTETAAWLSAGSTLTTSTYGYSSTSTRIGGSYAGSRKWNGAALASNGKIYSAGAEGGGRTDWAIINTNNDTIATTGSVNSNNFGARYDKITNQVFAMGGGGTKINCSTDAASNISGPSAYNGGAVQGFDGDKLYTAPLYINNNIYEYSISANTTTNKGATSGDRYPIGTLAANGKIFWGSGGGTQFTEYDPATSTLTNFGSFTGDNRGPTVAHYDGYLYNFPAFFNSDIIRLNPTTRAYTTIHTLSISPQIISTNTCVGLDGRIYVVRENGGVYWYDPYSNTSGNITMDSGDTSFGGITMGVNGDLYVVPFSSNYFHKIALTTGAGAGANAIVQQYNFGGRMCWQ
jgi:hypothetical protein